MVADKAAAPAVDPKVRATAPLKAKVEENKLVVVILEVVRAVVDLPPLPPKRAAASVAAARTRRDEFRVFRSEGSPA